MPSFFMYAPEEITGLPFNLRRSQIWPPNPPLTEQAITDQLDGRGAAVLMPQKMGFTKWHNGPAAQRFGESAMSSHGAEEIYASKVSALVGPIESKKGIFPAMVAARSMNRLPQAMDGFEFTPQPLARGLLERPIAQSDELTAYARAGQDPTMYMSMPTVTQRTLFSTALRDDRTPLGRVSIRRKTTGFLRGLGRVGMGFGALGDPLDIGAEPSYDPSAEGLQIPRVVTSSPTPGVVTTITTAGDAAPATGVDPSKVSLAPASPGWKAAFAFAGLAGGALGLYHGWNRTHSTPWTVGWGFAGAIFPIVAVPIMLFQGFGKRGGR
jgi:hypothetical protein